jgi:hypothetical protein
MDFSPMKADQREDEPAPVPVVDDNKDDDISNLFF